MKFDFDKMTRKFLMGEGRQEVNPHALLQALSETISSIKPRSLRDENKISIAKKHLHEITRSFRRLQEQVNILEEKLQVLEEVSTMAGGGAEGFAGPAFGDMTDENEKEKKRSKTNE
jgi:uncharacterized protein (UPF0305 family)